MTINNRDLYLEGVWDWGFLNDCFRPSRIKVTDIDGLVERNGRFLVLETKREGADIPQGQSILFRQYVKQGHWVLIIWGYQDSDTHDLLLLRPSGDMRYSGVGKSAIHAIVQDWYRWADGQGPFVPEELRPYLDRPLEYAEYADACAHVRQFEIAIRHGFAGQGRFTLSIEY